MKRRQVLAAPRSYDRKKCEREGEGGCGKQRYVKSVIYTEVKISL